ncbi:indole-3-glycerol phosphate synthase TrpC [Pontibacter akesuensis]|uniref:Indole-3-glycerol phosphate synthase n=1 Tax=Pontibacter akesuensis TaxID=388950 RepID=A0A1I7G896_9BACT|nr:indole-3-glycerol phosphate synthase TrpC [Pontibacter akesuensis]GHA58309.1 indole-3-glycerol phosphate synthase [Pontibacter akesuensis]SFU44476.1 indole-3-glycerol phosphate synthase [Pontibacter akesuensis]
MNILDEIIATKYKEVAERKELYPVKLLEKSLYFETPCISLERYLLRPDKSGIIAEIKRKSPSRGDINPYVSVERTSIGYMQAGASALSILTDGTYFGGKNEDLMTARKYNYCPILRKDFTVDEYQIVEAKSIGADAILLIAAALEPERLKELAAFARSFGLEVLLEVRDKEELDAALSENVNVVGVNNRNLKDFVTDINASFELAHHIPSGMTKISESGISQPKTLLELRQAGFNGFLIGENFMYNSRPERAASDFIREYRQLRDKLEAGELVRS